MCTEIFIDLFHNSETNLKEFQMENLTIVEIKKMLPQGGYQIISNRLNGKYTAGTVRQMFNGWRKMQDDVRREACELIKFINPEPKSEDQTI